ncbi:MAG: VOC family protein [Deltaproteobacteria bacterium]|nr:VOC family protein [Deltaproteobacteria bacterium]
MTARAPLLALWLLCAGAAAAAAAPLVTAVDAVGMTVQNMDRSVAFFREVLDFTPEADVEVAGDAYERLQGVFGLRVRVVRLRLGDETLVLSQYLAPEGRPIPVDSRSNDGWFQHVAIIVSDMDRAYARLRAHAVRHASSGPQTLPDWNPNAGGIRAFYFKDPDGHVLELLQFPPDKGAAKWHAGGDRLFLGIDHTAIVVADTDASLAFYRDALGLRVAGASKNYGTEQAHLNNVPGARLRITALRAAQGPGIELLEYLTPRDGRPLPADQRANDLAHWQTELTTPDVAAALAGLRARRAALVSPGVVDLPDDGLGFDAALLARDPDGHALELIQP